MEARAAGEEIGRLGGSKQLSVDARWSSDRPGYRRPERRGRTERPIHSTAGLDLEAGVVVVFDLAAECNLQAVGNERDLVLNKSGKPLSRHVRRQERQGRAVYDAIVDQAGAQSPPHVMSGPPPRTGLHIDVGPVPILPKHAR